METSKQRIERILTYKGINAKQLSEICGCQRAQVIYDVLNEKTKSISQNLSIKISSAFPEISRTWLLTGEGDMLIGTNSQNGAQQSISADSTKIIADMSAPIRSQQETIQRLLDEINGLRNELVQFYTKTA